MKQYVQKVCPVILRQKDETWQILAFRHPKAGTQLMKGTVEEGERPEAAVLRELGEESGIEQARIVLKIGEMGLSKTRQHWHLFLCQPAVELKDEWSFFTEDGGGLVFQFFWHELESEPDESWHENFLSALRFVRNWQKTSRWGTSPQL